MTTLTTLNRQRGVLKTKLNKITKFINEYDCTHLKESQEEQQEERLRLEGKKVSILEFKTSLRNLIESYTTLPEDVDIADSLEIARAPIIQAESSSILFPTLTNEQLLPTRRGQSLFSYRQLNGGVSHIIGALEIATELEDELEDSEVKLNIGRDPDRLCAVCEIANSSQGRGFAKLNQS